MFGGAPLSKGDAGLGSCYIAGRAGELGEVVGVEYIRKLLGLGVLLRYKKNECYTGRNIEELMHVSRRPKPAGNGELQLLCHHRRLSEYSISEKEYYFPDPRANSKIRRASMKQTFKTKPFSYFLQLFLDFILAY